MTQYFFVEPNDSLFVRGNLAFGDAGEYGPSVMPPPPSLFAGAFRSAILGRDAQALARFTKTGATGNAQLDNALGTMDPRTGEVVEQGSLRLSWVSLARRRTDGDAGRIEPLFPPPADLVKLDSGFVGLTPEPVNPLVADGRNLPAVAVLRTPKQTKPEGGLCLSVTGWQRHLLGELPDATVDAINASALYARDPRLGIGLDTTAGTVQSGLIYTTEGHAFSPPTATRFGATGFLVGLDGADDLLGESGFLRLGGDGRGAGYQSVDYRPPAPPLDAIAANGRFRLVLTTPGLFTDGWLPPGVYREGEQYLWRAAECAARLVCAAVPRREVISGWDLFRWKPKDAQRVAPAGSVYWLEDLEGPVDKLAAWVAGGLWGDTLQHQRQAEGYNLAWLAAWT